MTHAVGAIAKDEAMVITRKLQCGGNVVVGNWPGPHSRIQVFFPALEINRCAGSWLKVRPTLSSTKVRISSFISVTKTGVSESY